MSRHFQQEDQPHPIFQYPAYKISRLNHTYLFPSATPFRCTCTDKKDFLPVHCILHVSTRKDNNCFLITSIS